MNLRLQNALSNPDTVFFLVPGARIKEMIARNEHPYIQSLPETVKAELLAGSVYPLEHQMVIDFLNKRLDAKNQFLLQHCDILAQEAPDLNANLAQGTP
jgi:hypothetical protein